MHIVEEVRRLGQDLLGKVASGGRRNADAHVLHGGEEYELIIIAPELPDSD